VLYHLAFAVGLALLSAAVVRAMIAARVLDRPDPRKVHTQDTPKGGGVGVVVAFLVGIAVLYRFAEFARLADPYFIRVIEASVAIAIVAFLGACPFHVGARCPKTEHHAATARQGPSSQSATPSGQARCAPWQGCYQGR
jgi:UDP-N-acetylmuramyl pentapeptide phosphotransferase/UDP-N-acetylglucosamine-1-phosphate transferase